MPLPFALVGQITQPKGALPPAPAAGADAQALVNWAVLFDRHNEVSCLMLGTMSPKLYQQLEHNSPLEMVTELQKMYGKPSGANAQALVDWAVLFYRQNEVACLMLGTMSPKLYQQFEHNSPLEMVTELQKMDGKPSGANAQALVDWAVLFYRQNEVACLMLGTIFILNSLSIEFQAFVQNYNMQSVEKTISEVHSLLIEFEKSIKRNKQPRVGASSTPQVMTIQGGRVQKYKPQGKAKGKGKCKGPQYSYPTKPKKPQPYKKERLAKDGQCHHCKEEIHWKRNCPVYLAELMKKKKKTRGQNVASTSSCIYTIELFAFPKNSWVYDTGCGTHICNTKQGLRGAKKLKRGSLYLYVGNGVRAEVEAIGSFDLVLPNALIIVLDNCHYAPSITRGVVSVSRLVDKVYSISNKRTKSNLDSTYLWHCRLAHINKKHIEKLQHDGLLKSMDNELFDQCVSCISSKMTRKPFSHKTEKVKDVLGLIHTDVCDLLRCVSKKGASYLITFTDDYSRYGYVYSLKHKHEVFETFKVFKSEVENQLEKTIKAIRSDRGDFLEKDFILQTESERIIELENEDILPFENTSEHPIEEESLAPIVSQEEDVIPVRRSRLVVVPPNAKVVKSKWIYKKKTDMDGKVHIYKARLVAKGCTQTYGIDYEETFSPVADIRAIRTLIAIAAYYDYEI
uniref:Retrotransposon protein, putative, Ty1-copia subclass n=1 Tax=Tanacetum cinerariifolium TaxID=118510 RepID=A0A6L2KXZ8_TANCI|nr:hypothetical protein [Tanacetum cinerariifolium]